MWLILVEALAALCLLIFIVWWTMFSGREPDVKPDATPDPTPDPTPDDPPSDGRR